MKFHVNISMPFVSSVSQEQIFDLQAECKVAWMSIVPQGVKEMLFLPENMTTYDVWFEPAFEIVFNPLSKNTNVNIYYKKPAMANDDTSKPYMYELAENIHLELASKMKEIAQKHFE